MKKSKLGFCRIKFGLFCHVKILVNTWSLLFQKVHLGGVFAFFSVLSVSRSQFWSYDHENGIKLIPRTFGTNVSSRFLIEGLKIFFWDLQSSLTVSFSHVWMSKWVKNGFRNFENPFLRSKNQIFFLTQ